MANMSVSAVLITRRWAITGEESDVAKEPAALRLWRAPMEDQVYISETGNISIQAWRDQPAIVRRWERRRFRQEGIAINPETAR